MQDQSKLGAANSFKLDGRKRGRKGNGWDKPYGTHDRRDTKLQNLHQEEEMQIDINVKSVTIPRNETTQIVEKLRKINKLKNNINKLSELRQTLQD